MIARGKENHDALSKIGICSAGPLVYSTLHHCWVMLKGSGRGTGTGVAEGKGERDRNGC